MMEASNLLSMSLKASPPISLAEMSTATKIPLMAFATCTEASMATISPSTSEVTRTEASMATISPSMAETTATEASTTAMMLDKSDVNNTGGKIDDANESVLYHNLFDGDSSHVPIDHASHSGTLFPLI